MVKLITEQWRSFCLWLRVQSPLKVRILTKWTKIFLNNFSKRTQFGIITVWAGMNIQLRVLLKKKFWLLNITMRCSRLRVYILFFCVYSLSCFNFLNSAIVDFNKFFVWTAFLCSSTYLFGTTFLFLSCFYILI